MSPQRYGVPINVWFWPTLGISNTVLHMKMVVRRRFVGLGEH